MDVDERQEVVANKFRTENLYVAGEHDKVHILAQQVEDLLFAGPFIFGIGEQIKRNSVKLGKAAGGGMTADDGDDVTRKLASALAVQQVGETMVVG